MNFASDNTSGASPAVLEALMRANAGSLPSYGADPHTTKAKQMLAEVFDCEPTVALVTTGTASNALALATVAAATLATRPAARTLAIVAVLLVL